jgi:hypothetical protein
MNARGAIGFDARIDSLQTRLQAGIQSGSITRAEAQQLRPQLRQLRDLERQYSMNGLTQTEQRDLQQRIRTIRQQLRVADNNDYDRYEQRDLWSEYDGNGYRNGQQAYRGVGGGYEEVGQVCASRGVIGNLIGSLVGGNNCLQVGQRATGNLSYVPPEYRGQFRDGGGYTYRWVDGNVVQIDARTGVVARIWDVD